MNDKVVNFSLKELMEEMKPERKKRGQGESDNDLRLLKYHIFLMILHFHAFCLKTLITY